MAVDLFGKSGQGMINLIARGGKGLAEMEEEASKLGVAVSDLDAAKIEEAHEATVKLWAAFAGIGQTIAIAVAQRLPRRPRT